MSKTEKDAIQLLARIKFAYEKLPHWLQQGIARWDATRIELENKSSILATATTSSSARGGSFNIVFLDEFAFVPGNVAEEFFTSVYPTISSGKKTKFIIVSTPNGMNLFYHLFDNAEKKKNDFVPLTVDWRRVPGRDETWEATEKRNLGRDKFEQEYNVMFLGSANTLISPSVLRILTTEEPIEIRGGLSIFKQPEKDKRYVLCCDTSEGVGKDFSAFSVIDVSQKPYEIVAKFKNANESVLTYPNVILSVARKYNMAYVLIEVNDLGNQVANTLFHEFNYENMFGTQVIPGKLGQHATLDCAGKNKKLGLKMSSAAKRIGCANLKDIIENQQLKLNDFEYIVELSNFVKTRDSFAAKQGESDDLVMTLVLFGWLCKQEVFEQLSKTSIQPHFQTHKEELHLPFPIRLNYAEQYNTLGGAGFIDDNGDVWQSADMPINYPIGYKR